MSGASTAVVAWSPGGPVAVERPDSSPRQRLDIDELARSFRREAQAAREREPEPEDPPKINSNAKHWSDS
jgi:hypothetical protein